MKHHDAGWRTPAVVLVCAGLVLTLGMGIRHGFGLFLQPMSADLGWGRETFALAMAVQNLMWGATQPFAGMLADKYGTARIVVIGALLYLLGLVTMAHAATPVMLVLTAGVLIGTGLSGLTFSIMAGVLGRRFPPEQRSMALGISAAAGSFGQFAMLPATQWLLSNLGWYGALVALGVVGLLMVPLALGLVERHAPSAHAFCQSAVEAMVGALGHRGYVLLTLGFVCGFQVVFVGVHLPAYLAGRGMAPHVAVTALALIGLFNIVSTYSTGWLGRRMPKRYILSAIYFGFYYWFPKAMGFRLKENWGKRAFWCWLIGFYLAFMPLYVLGFMGMPRRMAHYVNPAWHPYLLVAALGSAVILLGIIFQGIQLLVSIKERRALADPTGDPWDGRTLEWMTSSPPAAYNFAKIPVVNEIDAFTDMKEKGAAYRRPDHYNDIEMPKNAPHGFTIGGLALVFGFAMIWHIWWLAILAALGMLFTVIDRSVDDDIHYVIPAAEVERIENER